MKLAVHVLFLALVPLMARGGALMPCPDCGHEVSKRALMCPSCGLKGEIIAQAAKELETKSKPKEPDRWVIADFGKETCRALPVRMVDGTFIVLPLEKTFRLETLIFTYASTNTTIGYGIPEVALDRPLIRFPITATNLVFAAADTNIYSELAQPNAVKVDGAIGWRTIQPMALKNHGKVLLRIKAGEDTQLPPKAHPYYKQLEAKWKQERNAK